MRRLRHTVEQILAKLREAEVALSKGQPAAEACRTLASPNKRMTAGAMSTVCSRSMAADL